MPDDRLPAPEQPSGEQRLSNDDRRRLRRLGISEEQVRRQIELLRRPRRHTSLARPCTPGDGIRVLEPDEEPRLLALWRQAAREGRLLKLVPASGAASRMFGQLRQRAGDAPPGSRERLERLAAHGDDDAGAVLRLLDDLPRLPFAAELAATVAQTGEDLGDLVRTGAYVAILDRLLGPSGLGYGSAPKALIAFHRYPGGARTAFAEQLVESMRYLTDGGGLCRLHFTVAAAQREAFDLELAAATRPRQAPAPVTYQVGFSTQHPSTDTVAIDEAGRPFRDAAGEILLRPAGHGALLANLAELEGDLVMVQNIDNVVPEHLQDEVVRWKRLLAGATVQLELELAALRRRLQAAADDQAEVSEVAAGLSRLLALEPPPGLGGRPLASWARTRLDRPLRVCGVVPNVGEPGGGPFWVADRDGAAGGQIIEPPEVDHEDPRQSPVWQASTHFNPVNMVLSLRDPSGRPYPLEPLVDPDRYLVVDRRHGGRDLRVLERPGLWNGSMAGWNTCFVELPIATFNPVKTVFDLLRPEHQPADL